MYFGLFILGIPVLYDMYKLGLAATGGMLPIEWVYNPFPVELPFVQLFVIVLCCRIFRLVSVLSETPDVPYRYLIEK